MGFTFLRTVSFRNLTDSETDVRGRDIFLVGENGQGKSNFLEALYFCSYASSFRGARDSDMARTGENAFSVSSGFDNNINNNLNITYREKEKKIILDGKKIDDRKELLRVTPSIIFCHEDMDFVSGTPERRRWFFDQTRSLWDSLYLEDLQKYRYVLKNRNLLLRNLQQGINKSENEATLLALDPQLSRYGLELSGKRRETAEEFSAVFEPLYKAISGIDGINIKYTSSWKADSIDGIMEHLAEKQHIDISMGVSRSGPHRDRYSFLRGGMDFSGNASTGQRRLLALLLRIAQAKIFSERTGNKPVFLLDDVLLELDGEKRKRFISLLPEYEQAFYTFLPIEPYESYRKSDTIVYNVENGSITPNGSRN